MSDTTAHHGYGIYWKIWGWLLFMTMLALGVGYVDMPQTIKAFALVGITLGKVVLIGAFFMHLRSEKLDLVLITFCPIILSLILFFFMFPDSGDSATRMLNLR
jgi:caa(3)-type oxidase subunit IV